MTWREIAEGSLEVKLPTIWTDEKQRWEEYGRVREEKRREEERRSKRASLRRRKIQGHQKVGKFRNTVFLQWFVAPEGRKVNSLKRRVRSQLARWAKRTSTRPSALHSTFYFWKKSRRIALLRFWCCQLRKMRKSRGIVSFLTLSSSKIKEVS